MTRPRYRYFPRRNFRSGLLVFSPRPQSKAPFTHRTFVVPANSYQTASIQFSLDDAEFSPPTLWRTTVGVDANLRHAPGRSIACQRSAPTHSLLKVVYLVYPCRGDTDLFRCTGSPLNPAGATVAETHRVWQPYLLRGEHQLIISPAISPPHP